MPRIIVGGAAAGATAGQGMYRVALTFAAVAVGTYVVNNANFAGIAPFLPGPILIGSGTPANVTTTVADNAGVDRQVGGTGGAGLLFVDPTLASGTGGVVKIVIATGATNIYLWIPAW